MLRIVVILRSSCLGIYEAIVLESQEVLIMNCAIPWALSVVSLGVADMYILLL